MENEAPHKQMQIVIDQWKEGNVAIRTIGGVFTTPIENFVNQPADGILYDLNRLEEVSLTDLQDPRWVNDFATAKVIRYLKEQNKQLLDKLHLKN